MRRQVARRIESLAVLEAGFDLDDWAILDDASERTRDDERDWNKIGGNPRWLQGDETPDEPGGGSSSSSPRPRSAASWRTAPRSTAS